MQAGGENGGGSGHAAATYRGLRTRRGTAAMGDINVTPLVDVVLVLLLVFMVTAPMMSRGIDVQLPVAESRDNPPQDRVTVYVDQQEQIHLGDKPVTLAQLEELLRARSTPVVYLQADERLRYGKVIEVVDRIKRAGVEKLGFVYVLPEEKDR